jgi:membrane protease YdiL (CAAX protease family)
LNPDPSPQEWWTDRSADQPARHTFSLDGRPAAGLYLLAWLLGGLGLALLLLSLGGGTVLGVVALPLLCLSLASAAGYQVVARRGRPAVAYRGPSPLILFGLVFFGWLLGTVVVFIGAGLAGVDVLTDPPTALTASPALTLAIISAQLVAYLVVGWLAVVRTGALSWRDIALPPSAARGLPAAIGLGIVVMVPVLIAAIIFGGLLATLLGVDAPDVLPAPQTATDFVLVAIAGALLAPVGEEFFFRGIALQAWLRDLGARSALIRATLLFAFIHVINISGVDFSTGLRQAILVVAVILPVGLALGWLYIRRGLAASFAAHATYNGLLLALPLLLPDLVAIPR